MRALTFITLMLLSSPMRSRSQPTAAPTQNTSSKPRQQAPDLNPAWMQALASRHQQLMDRNGPGIDPVLTSALLQMAATDQEARAALLKQPAPANGQRDFSSLRPVDLMLTNQLKQIVAKNGWPTIHKVGFDASNAAMLILIHTEDQAWQKSLLPSLENLADQDDIDGSTLALVVDKQLVAAGKPQRYGTQFKFTDGTLAMYTVESPATLDARRAKVMLPPLDAYREMLASLYHVTTSDRIIPPDAPATP